MAGAKRFVVVLAATVAALVLGVGAWLPRPASLAASPPGPAPADLAGSVLVVALDQVTLAIDGMT
jgi:hypothetical protein